MKNVSRALWIIDITRNKEFIFWISQCVAYTCNYINIIKYLLNEVKFKMMNYGDVHVLSVLLHPVVHWWLWLWCPRGRTVGTQWWQSWHPPCWSCWSDRSSTVWESGTAASSSTDKKFYEKLPWVNCLFLCNYSMVY